MKTAKQPAAKKQKPGALVPKDYIEQEGTKYALTAHPFLSEKQILKVFQRTPATHIYKRPARGGGEWEYVTGTYIKKCLNFIFGWRWSFEYSEPIEKYGQIVINGKLTVFDEKGNAVVKMQAGRAEIKFKKGTKDALDYGNDVKAAATDALKKCAAELGIASDVYGKNEFKEIGREPKKPAPVESVDPEPEAEPVVQVLECHGCAGPLTAQESEYSTKLFKQPLCRGCQATQQK